MRISVQHPFEDIRYYLATQDGPLRPIICEGSSYAEVFVSVLTQIAEQGRELSEGRR